MNAYNDIMLERLAGESTEVLSCDMPVVDAETGSVAPVDFLNTIELSGLPPHRLKLKRGAPIMCIWNVSPDEECCNGTRFVVERVTPNALIAKYSSGPRKGKIFTFYKYKIAVEEEDFPVKFYRIQFPVRLAFAFTAHKAQGQTLNKVGINLLTDFFVHGQLYVALSRARSPEDVRCLVRPDATRTAEGIHVANIVYDEVLRDEI